MRWFRRSNRQGTEDTHVHTVMAQLEESRRREAAAKEAAQVDGRHYTEWVPVLDKLRSQKRDDDALSLLMRLLPAVEAEARIMQRPDLPLGHWLAPGYYERAAIIFRRKKDYASEVAILERYFAIAPDSNYKLAERLEKARKLLANQ